MQIYRILSALLTSGPAIYGRFLCLLVCLLALASCSDQTEDSKVAVPIKTPFQVVYQAGENGHISGPAEQLVAPGADGELVTAQPASGYHFVRWNDGVETPERVALKVTAALTVTAEFAVNKYRLKYSSRRNGTLVGDLDQTVTSGGTGSLVKAVAAVNYHFVRWSDGVTSPERSDRQVTADLTVAAEFAIDRHLLTYVAAANGSIVGKRGQKVAHRGIGATVTAVAAEGYRFVSWSDGLTVATRHEQGVTGALKVTASFAPLAYILDYSAGEHGSLKGDFLQTVTHGNNGVEVTAVPAPGYHFVSWSDGVKTARRVEQQVTGELSVQAQFAVNTYAVGGRVSGLVEGTVLVLQNNGADDLTVLSNGAFSFATELLDAAAYQVSLLTQPASPNQTCSVLRGSGTVSAAVVADIEITCILNRYSIGGSITGLPAADRVTLRNNDGAELTINANGPFLFPVALDDHSSYQVKITTLPKKERWTCDLKNASGSLAGQDVTAVEVDCYPLVILQAEVGIRKVKLSWNHQDFAKVKFQLCQATDEIAENSFAGCRDLEGGSTVQLDTSPYTISQLINDIPYWFQLQAVYPDGRKTLSAVITAIPFGGLNDTGIDWCANGFANLNADRIRAEKAASCKSVTAGFSVQDALQGRDRAFLERHLKKTGSGAAGFDFTKICRNGEAAGEGRCPPNPAQGKRVKSWGATRDNVTGLIWEVKAVVGLQGKQNTYSWYNPRGAVNGGYPGVPAAGKCEGSACDTSAYIDKMNENRLCGFDDWRLPTREELLSIVNNGRFKPAADLRFFPNSVADYYWSSTPYSEMQEFAWQVYFLSGEAYPDEKKLGKHVRLVRGKTGTFGMDNP